MRKNLVTAIVAAVTFVAGIGAHTFIGNSATARTSPMRVHRCFSLTAGNTIAIHNLSNKEIRNVETDSYDIDGNLLLHGTLVSLAPHGSSQVAVTDNKIIETRGRGTFTLSGTSGTGDAIRSLRCT